MVDETTTVDLPADPRVKQLSHDVVREDAEWAVPLLTDFYQYLSAFDVDDHKTLSDIRSEVDADSEFDSSVWQHHIDLLEDLGYVEKHRGGQTTYTLAEDLESGDSSGTGTF